MSADIFRSESDRASLADRLQPVRVVGGIGARFQYRDGRTVLARLAERGGYRLAQPVTEGPALDVLQVNTGGGVAGGDRVELRYALGPGADVVHTSSSAERIYRSDGAPARLGIHLELASSARLDWLPHQTILYAGSELERRIEVDMAASSRLLVVEVLAFGRPASRERDVPARIVDQWRIRRDGTLVLAEALRLSGDLANVLERPAIGGGARSAALLVLVGADAPDLVEPTRQALATATSEFGVSAWRGLLVARLMARGAGALLRDVGLAASVLSGRPLPRAWAS